MLTLQRDAKALGVDISTEIKQSGWVAARQLMQDLAEEINDYADEASDEFGEIMGEPVKFSDLDHFA